MRLSLITAAVAAYLHSHPEAFDHAFALSVVMWLTLAVWAVLWVFGALASAAASG